MSRDVVITGVGAIGAGFTWGAGVMEWTAS